MNGTMGESAVSLRFGLVAERDPATCRVKVRLPDLDGLVTDWISVPQRAAMKNKSFNTPDIDEQVSVLLDARGETGVLLGSHFSTVDAPPSTSGDITSMVFEDGTSIAYARAAKSLSIQAAGDITITVAGTASISAATVNISGADGDVVVAGISLRNHQHKGVIPGSGLSGPPEGTPGGDGPSDADQAAGLVAEWEAA